MILFRRNIKSLFFGIWYIRLQIGHILEKKKVRKFNRNGSELFFNNMNSDEKMVKIPVIIAEVKNDKKAIVTIISDDGFFDSGVLLNQLVKKYDICATVAGAVSILKPHLSEWKKIVSEGYIEIVNHSYKHATMQEESDISKDRDRLYYELIRAKKWIEHQFQDLKQIVFVCPGNVMCELGYKILGKGGYFAVRRGDRGYNSLAPENGTNSGQWFNLMVQGIGDEGTCTQVRNSWVDFAIQNNKWLIEMWHNVAVKEDGFYQTILKEDAEAHLEYIAKCKNDQKIWVATFTEATKYIREKQAMDVEAYLVDECIYIGGKLTDEKLSERIFDYPVTVKIEIPDNLKKCSFYVDENEIVLVDENTLMLDIVPNGEIIKIDVKSKQTKGV